MLQLIALWNTSFWKINRYHKIFIFAFVDFFFFLTSSPFHICLNLFTSLFASTFLYLLCCSQRLILTKKASVFWMLSVSAPCSYLPLHSLSHPPTHTPTHSLTSVHTHTHRHTHLSIFLSHQRSSSYYIVQAVAMETGAAAEWQTREWGFYLSVSSLCISARVCVCMNANVCLPFVVVCVWPRRLISPVLCAACHDARTRLDTVYQHRPHGFAPPHLLFPFFPLLLPSVHPVLGLSPNMRLSWACSGALWRWLKEKSVATVCIAI